MPKTKAKRITIEAGGLKRRLVLLHPPFPRIGDVLRYRMDEEPRWQVTAIEDTDAYLIPLKREDGPHA
jgi:hypothetical protein